MKYFQSLITFIAITSCLSINSASALTATQFQSICAASKSPCSDNPVIQAYVGGSLDLLAVLTEETVYLERIYCEDASSLFDVAKIIEYIQTHHQEYAEKNAMLLVVRYFEKHGEC